MDERFEPTGDEDWVIWNGGLGLVTTAALGDVETAPNGQRMAWLDEPFDMVGPFDLDELERCGRIAFAACIVMSRQRWRADQAALRRESVHLKREAQRRMEDAFARFSRHQHRQATPSATVDERPHREALALPLSGALGRSQINAAFRRLAQRAHPDAGGDHERFVRLSKARQVLLAAAA
ncbi:MAG: J domain-containing protein [Rhodocyclaceae bacterium]|nr:J domain-containing protein [Rhodocyclaceae bacterium]